MTGLQRCEHGGFARDGVCIMDALHPPVPCAKCGVEVCPCSVCLKDHAKTTGHEVENALIARYRLPNNS
jgi:hypothetical protein